MAITNLTISFDTSGIKIITDFVGSLKALESGMYSHAALMRLVDEFGEKIIPTLEIAGPVPGNPEFRRRIEAIISDITLPKNYSVKIGFDGRFYFQIAYYREDVITHEMGMGYGGKAYLSEHASDSELVQTVFGLYKGFWEHEARETFQWRDRRVFGPHIATEALWDVAKRVDLRKEKEDQA